MPETTPRRDMTPLYIPGAIILAGLIIGICLIIAFSNKSASQAVGTGIGAPAPAVAANIKDVKIAGDPYIGKVNAPVTLAYWSDYQCPFCKQFEQQTLSEIIKKYVDTGKVKVVFKDYPFLGEDSTTAALYEHAVWELYPAKFFTWREAMFNAQDAEGDQGFGDEASIVALTQKIAGIDVNRVKAQVAAKKDAYTTAITADRTEGSNFGIQGTPGFITGTTLIPGAVPLAQFTAAIDAQLK